ncbi:MULTISPECIES: DUF2929 family protein [Oceanobacillus]|uniref:DUF2929 family protein n=1 Tax=Oceanobacillus neutriphilus TaxID=531815 RepID=A0ABQ2NZE2_9BACI|nr:MULTISPECIES: DUF2929 family protein [Oceanobacillus]MCT1904012.1 YjzD family protein [Oceanobacillus sojae]GGP14411.1 hypothetical protein GCM10011346_38260 [Oceanobacillus neutriphilus]
MRYIMTIFWAVVISLAVSYVLTSMGAEPFVIRDALILAGIFVLAVFALAGFVLKEDTE